MIIDFEETRYPFISAFDFFSNGYAFSLQGLHLTIGWFFIIYIVFFLFKKKELPVEYSLSIFYVAFAIFTNPAYDVFGLKVNEIAGVLSIFSAIFKGRLPKPKSMVSRGLLSVFLLGLVHNILLLFIYPDLNPDISTLLLRIGVNFKIFVLAFNLALLSKLLDLDHHENNLNWLVKIPVVVGVFGLFMYIFQIVLLILGISSYGTYLDAGFVGIPSFGSVSVERGHFGKFMAPLFPFFLFAMFEYKWKWQFLLYILIMTINFSASSQTFLIFFILLTMFEFRKKILNLKVMISGAVFLIFAVMISIEFSDVFLGVYQKIINATLNDEIDGVRSYSTFVQYLAKYPLGIGYSGSSLRNAPDLPVLDAAYYAFVTQYSILALFIVIGLVMIYIHVLKSSSCLARGNLLNRCMRIGVLGSLLIFVADILWFIPTIWLAFEIILSCKKRLAGVSAIRSV